MKYKLEFKHKKKDFKDVYNIETHYLTIENISTVKQIRKWDKINNDIHIFVRCVSSNKIVGEITLLPLSLKQYNKFINGDLKDTEINEKTLLKYKKNQNYYLLFSTIAIDKDYRNDKEILGLLLDGLIMKIEKLYNKNITILNMCSEGQTKEGIRFIEMFLKMNLICKSNEGYNIYAFKDKEGFANWFSNFKIDVIKYYKKSKLLKK